MEEEARREYHEQLDVLAKADTIRARHDKLAREAARCMGFFEYEIDKG